MSHPLSLTLVGATGRMGLAIQNCVRREPERFRLAALPGRSEALAEAVAAADVVIDFSLPATLEELLAACRAARKPLVIGTTGYDLAARDLIASAAEEIPLLLASNFSVGVNTLFWLARQATLILGPGFDLEIVETHHRLKRDAPSGTAVRLAEVLAEAREVALTDVARHGREGIVGARPAGEIGLHAVRGGDVVGEHTVLFAGDGERVELTHRASSRETFALGALRAAAWLVQQPAGRVYDMEDLLGLRQLGS